MGLNIKIEGFRQYYVGQTLYVWNTDCNENFRLVLKFILPYYIFLVVYFHSETYLKWCSKVEFLSIFTEDCPRRVDLDKVDIVTTLLCDFL